MAEASNGNQGKRVNLSSGGGSSVSNTDGGGSGSDSGYSSSNDWSYQPSSSYSGSYDYDDYEEEDDEDEGGGYTYYSEADDDDEWEDYFRAEFIANEASHGAWDSIHEAERNLDMLGAQKAFYDSEFNRQNATINEIANNAGAMARRTSDNDFIKNMQDFQAAARNAMTANGGQYGSWAQSLNNLLDEGVAQQTANNANTLEYNLQDAQDNRVNQLNDLIKNYNQELRSLEDSKMNIDSNLKSSIGQQKRNLAGNLASLTQYDPRSQYIGDWGEMLDTADKSGWFQYADTSIDGIGMDRYDFMKDRKNYENPVLVDNIKSGQQIAKKLAGYSTDNGVLERLTSTYSNRR